MLNFKVYTSDGNHKKTFKDIKQAVAHFGEGYATSDVSNDGVVRAVPLDQATEDIVEDYRKAAHLNSVVRISDSMILGSKLSENVKESLKYSSKCKGEDAIFFLRDGDDIELAFKMLIEQTEDENTILVREDVLVSYDDYLNLLVVEDHSGKAEKLSELLNRPFALSAKHEFISNLPNEDEGSVRTFKLGSLVGQIHTMVDDLNRIDDIVMNEDRWDTISSSRYGYSNHQKMPELIFSGKRYQPANYKWGTNTTLQKNGGNEIVDVVIVNEDIMNKIGVVTNEPAWISFYDYDEKNDHETVTKNAKQINIGDLIDIKNKTVIKKDDLSQTYGTPTEEAKQEYNRSKLIF